MDQQCLKLVEETAADGLIGSYYVVSGNRWSKRLCRPKPPAMPMAEYILSGTGDACTSTMIFRRAAIIEILFDETLQKHQDWDLAIRFERKFKLAVDPAATIVAHSHPYSMSRYLNHAATQRFLENYWPSLSQETKARFCLLFAWRTFNSEGRSENFREWLRKAREASPRRLIFKGVLLALSVPLLERLTILILNSYFWFKRCRTTQRLKANWRTELGLPPLTECNLNTQTPDGAPRRRV